MTAPLILPEKLGSEYIAGSAFGGSNTVITASGNWPRAYFTGDVSATPGTYPAFGSWGGNNTVAVPFPVLAYEVLVSGTALGPEVAEFGYLYHGATGVLDTVKQILSWTGGIQAIAGPTRLPVFIMLPPGVVFRGRTSGTSGGQALRLIRADQGLPSGLICGPPGCLVTIMPDDGVMATVTPGSGVYGTWKSIKKVCPFPFIPTTLVQSGSNNPVLTSGTQVGYTVNNGTSATIVAEFPGDSGQIGSGSCQQTLPYLPATIPAGAQIMIRSNQGSTTTFDATLNGVRADLGLWRT